jgi:hypothetical protein
LEEQKRFSWGLVLLTKFCWNFRRFLRVWPCRADLPTQAIHRGLIMTVPQFRGEAPALTRSWSHEIAKIKEVVDHRRILLDDACEPL